MSNSRETCLQCGKVAVRVDGHLSEPWTWRYSTGYGNRFLPKREWERFWFCSPECVEPYDRESDGTAYA